MTNRRLTGKLRHHFASNSPFKESPRPSSQTVRPRVLEDVISLPSVFQLLGRWLTDVLLPFRQRSQDGTVFGSLARHDMARGIASGNFIKLHCKDS